MAISARIDELKKKFDENPRRYFASLANEYRKAGDLDQALFICQEYLPQQPGHMSGHIVLAQTQYEMGRLPEAKAEFEAALALDPENLIALRHLGDIARQSGDPRTARNWYQRVLEADPRNSEIVDVLASLRTTPMASAAAISAIPPTPLSNEVMPAPTPLNTAVIPPVAPAAFAPTPMPHAEPVHEEHELLDFESISLGETPLSSPSVPPPQEASGAFELTMPVQHPIPEIDLGADAFEADAFAIAAPEPAPVEPQSVEPPIEPATDIALGIIDNEFAPASSVDVEPTMIEGLRSYEAGSLIKSDALIDKSLDTDPYYDVLHGVGRSTPPEPALSAEATPPNDDDFAPGFIEHDTVLGEEPEPASLQTPIESESFVTPHVSSTPMEGLESFEDDDEADFTPHNSVTPHASSTPVSAATPVGSAEPVVEEAAAAAEVETSAAAHGATPAAGSEIFVTETMADLYLSQGHTGAALDIYRKLLEHRPGDPRLSERIREVESRVSGRASRISTPEITAEPIAPRGPTIREFLVALVGSKPTEISPDFASDSFAEPASDEQVAGSIDALFPAHESGSSDDEHTNALAEAFSESSSDSPMLEGRPAHPASNELSLDQVFKVSTPVRSEAQPSGFSFDQFFAGDSTASSASPPNSNTPPAEGTDDIAQFNAWLNGLKKT